MSVFLIAANDQVQGELYPRFGKKAASGAAFRYHLTEEQVKIDAAYRFGDLAGIVADYSLPRGSKTGLDLVREVREDHRYRELPLPLRSGRTGRMSRETSARRPGSWAPTSWTRVLNSGHSTQAGFRLRRRSQGRGVKRTLR